tara:strand:+ start:703 stop:1119 length:417 start_codon:yes stop_codon:yes gene_type:complete
MKLLFILFLGLCFSDENIYTVIAINEDSELINYKNVYFIEDNFISMKFQDKSGNTISLNNESIQKIHDINGNEITKINLIERYTGIKLSKSLSILLPACGIAIGYLTQNSIVYLLSGGTLLGVNFTTYDLEPALTKAQ